MIKLGNLQGKNLSDDLSERLTPALHSLEVDPCDLPVHGYRPPGQGPEFIPLRTAGVLLPILCHPQGATMLFTVRSLELPTHPGQVSFPGGSVEICDVDEVAASVRETHEEVGIHPQKITPLGMLDKFDTISGYRMVPVVGLVKTPVSLVLDSSEVSAAFEVPLAEVLDRSCYQKRIIEYAGRQHTVYSRQWQQHNIWGATAAVLVDLIDKLTAEA
ncbi:MAG: CoA pyrophosphatase [Xanthomonadales bacterium]|nr:CoA pyrophosphatase [Xanthomonadales bacterium]